MKLNERVKINKVLIAKLNPNVESRHKKESDYTFDPPFEFAETAVGVFDRIEREHCSAQVTEHEISLTRIRHQTPFNLKRLRCRE